MKTTPLLLLVVTLVGLLSGCATQLNSNVTTGTNLSDVKKFHVVRLPKDERGVDRIIADRLNAMGKQATAGEKTAAPADIDAIVTYQDKWMWDISMYMLELNIQFRKPQSEVAIATGHSLRTSLVRKSPAEMVDEVITEIFKKR